MEIQTKRIDNFLFEWDNYVELLHPVLLPSFLSDIDKVNDALYTYHRYDYSVPRNNFSAVINEVRQNLVAMVQVEVMSNYRFYIFELFDEKLLALNKLWKSNQLSEDEIEALWNDREYEDEEPYKTFQRTKQIALGELEEMMEECEEYKSKLVTIIDKAIKFNSQPLLSQIQTTPTSAEFMVLPPSRFSHKQIAIAYCLMKQNLTKDNAADVLERYSTNNSVAKLLQHVFTSGADIVRISENKSADTKHRRDLLMAKRLIETTSNNEALNAVELALSTFDALYLRKYEK